MSKRNDVRDNPGAENDVNFQQLHSFLCHKYTLKKIFLYETIRMSKKFL